MANVNKVILIGRLTREPETRTFANGGKVVILGFAVSNRKKDQQTGEWKDDPMFIDCKIFGSSESSRQADLALQSLHKGHQVYLEGHLVLETWDDKNGGGKRSKHALIIDNFQFLEPRAEGVGGGGNYQQRKPAVSSMSRQSAPPPAEDNYFDDGPPPSVGRGGHGGGGGGGGSDEEIPF